MTVKEAALGRLKNDIEKKYGQHSVMFANDIPVRPPISSGSLALDFATGIGGLPSDRCIEVSGNEESGKTTLGLLSMTSFLDHYPDRAALILDTEHKLTMDWVNQLVGPERMGRVLLAWPDHMEQATNMFLDLVSSGQICFVLFDSIGGSPTKAITEKDAEKGEIGGSAKAISRFAKLASTHCQKYNCLLFGINQVRADMEGFHRHITPGGYAWKHACVMRIKLHRSTVERVEAEVNGEKMPIGYKVVAKVIKNQLAASGRQAYWWMYVVPTEQYGFGIDTTDEIVRLAVLTGVVDQRGAFYAHQALPDGKVQGREALIKAVRADEALKATIVGETMAMLADDGEVASKIAPITPDSEESDED